MPIGNGEPSPTPEERVQQAKGSFSKKALTKQSGRLSEQRVVDYLNPGEHLEYLLWHQSKGLRIIHPNGEEETPHHNSTTGCRFLLITDQRLCYLAGLENRDVQQNFGYYQLTDVEATDNTLTQWITFTTTDGTKYRFAETGTHWEDVEPAAVYIQEQIEKKHDKLNSNLRQQMRDAFEHGEYPATGLMDVAPALPKGPATTFQAGEFSVTAENLCSFIIFTSNMEFPYRTVDEFVDGILQELATHGYISSSDTHHFTDQSPGNGSDRSGQGTSDTEVYRPEDDRAGPGNAGTDQQPTGRMTGQSGPSPVEYCPYCGTDTSSFDESRFCHSCGKELD